MWWTSVMGSGMGWWDALRETVSEKWGSSRDSEVQGDGKRRWVWFTEDHGILGSTHNPGCLSRDLEPSFPGKASWGRQRNGKDSWGDHEWVQSGLWLTRRASWDSRLQRRWPQTTGDSNLEGIRCSRGSPSWEVLGSLGRGFGNMGKGCAKLVCTRFGAQSLG